MSLCKKLIMCLVLMYATSCFAATEAKGLNQLNEFVGDFSGKGKVFAVDAPTKWATFTNTFSAKLSVNDKYLEIDSITQSAGKSFTVKWMIYFNTNTGKYAAWMFHQNGNPYQLEGTYNRQTKTLSLKSLKPYGTYAYIEQKLTIGDASTFSAKAIFKSNVGQSIIKTCQYSRQK